MQYDILTWRLNSQGRQAGFLGLKKQPLGKQGIDHGLDFRDGKTAFSGFFESKILQLYKNHYHSFTPNSSGNEMEKY